MDNRSKFRPLAVLLLAFIIANIALIYTQQKRAVEATGENAVVFSKLVEQSIDGEKLGEIIRTKKKSEYYYEMLDLLSNAKASVGAKYIYIEWLSDDSLNRAYGFDSEGDFLGTKKKSINKDNFSHMKSFSTGVSDTIRLGAIVTGYTPILNDQGESIGLVGVEFAMDTANVILMRNIKALILFEVIVISLYLIFSILTLRIISKKSESSLAMFRFVVGALTASLSKKSDYTWRHSERVADYAEVMLTKMNKPRHLIETVKWGAVLHDIGKIGIASHILDKPDVLTDEEHELIKTHPGHSKDILQKIFNDRNHLFGMEELTIIADIAEFHHERWDGNGYPYGLKGEEIPLFARVVSVADAYEAMTAKRPYKSAIGKKTAVEEIRRNSGYQFDPDVVVVFLQCLEDKAVNSMKRIPMIRTDECGKARVVQGIGKCS